MIPRLMIDQKPSIVLGVDRADDVLAGVIVDGAVRILAAELVVDRVSVGADQAHLLGDRLLHEIIDRRAVNAPHDARNNLAPALHCADDRLLAYHSRAPRTAALTPVSVLVLAPDVGLVHFNDSANLREVLDERDSDAVAHVPRGFVRAESHVADDLQGAHSFLGGQHQVSDLEPVPQRLVRVLEDRPNDVRDR